MHYLVISSEFPPGPGGIGKHAYCMSMALVNNGIRVSIVCNMDHANETEITNFITILPEALTVHRIKRNGISTYINRIRTVIDLYKLHNFDKVIVTGQFSIWLGWLLKSLYKNKTNVIAFVHGSELLIGGSIKRYLTRAGLKQADKVYAVSNYTARLTKQYVSRDIDIIPNGLNVQEWDTAKDGETIKWNSSPNLLTVGSITPRKGQHNVIAALPALIKKHPDLHYHMVGLPAHRVAIIQQAQELNVQDYITIHGKVDDAQLKACYKAADIFIMLSEQDSKGDVEGFGIAVLEANISGIPAIGSKHSGIEDAIKDGYNGYLVDAQDSNAIAAAVSKLVDADKNTLSANCIDWALQHDWNKLVQPLL